MKRYDIINAFIEKYNFTTYLEIGVNFKLDDELTYKNLDLNRSQWLNLYSVEEFMKVLNYDDIKRL